MRARRAGGGGRPRSAARGDAAAVAGAREALGALGLALAVGADLPTLLGIAAEAARVGLGGAEARLFLVDESTGGVRPCQVGGDCAAKPAADGAGEAAGDGPADRDGEPCLPHAGGVLDWVLRRAEPVFAPAPSASGPRLEECLWGKRDGGFVALPLATRGTLLGVWVAALPTAHVFSRGERWFAHGVGDALAVALDRRSRERALAEAAEQADRLETRAEEGEALLAQMLSVVAHEMRTPLTCIKAYAETLIDTPAEQWSARVPFLEIINEECDRLGRLLTNALDYSRLESGQRSFHLTTLLPADLLQDVVLTLAPESKRRKVDLAVRAPDSFGSVEGDPDLLKQLCLNLVGNAIKFSPERTTVEMHVSGDHERWRLDVIDRGIGVPEDQRERIFERFYRVEQEGRKAVPGTGLGLAIARGIAELHGGRIWAAANPEGGSIFSVDLPRVQRAPEAARALAAQLWERPEVTRFLAEGVHVVSEVMEAQIVSAMLVDPARGDLRMVAALGLDDNAYKRRVGYRGGIAGKALAQAAPVLVNDIESDPRFRRPNHPQYNTKSLVCVPLLVDGEAVGVINVNNKRSRQPFDEQDLAVLSALAARLAAAAQRARNFAGAPEAVDEELAALRASIAPREEHVLGQRSAGALARELARRLGAGEAEALRLGALAEGRPLPDGDHRDGADGSLGASVDGDSGAGAHAGSGAGGRGAAPGPRRGRAGRSAALGTGDRAMALGGARDILLGRHEWWDGTGRPRGLAGEAIPLGARVLAAVDALRALTDGAAHRPATGPVQALDDLERAAGRRLDPRVVAAVADLVAEDAGLGAAATVSGAGRAARRRREA